MRIVSGIFYIEKPAFCVKNNNDSINSGQKTDPI